MHFLKRGAVVSFVGSGCIESRDMTCVRTSSGRLLAVQVTLCTDHSWPHVDATAVVSEETNDNRPIRSRVPTITSTTLDSRLWVLL